TVDIINAPAEFTTPCSIDLTLIVVGAPSYSRLSTPLRMKAARSHGPSARSARSMSTTPDVIPLFQNRTLSIASNRAPTDETIRPGGQAQNSGSAASMCATRSPEVRTIQRQSLRSAGPSHAGGV